MRERWLRFIYGFLRIIATPFFRLKFNYRNDSLSGVEGPYLLLCNHNTNFDPIFAGIAAKRRTVFVMAENALRKPFTAKLLKNVFDPIIHLKGRKSGKSTIDILKTLKKGTSVALFAEGNRSFDGVTGEIPPVTGKLAKKCGAKVVTYRIEGGYLTQPRWSKSLRRGAVTGKLIHVYTVEELAGMTDREVYDAICKDLYENAWENQRRQPVRYKGRKLAEGMESTLYACPDCGRISTLTSAGNTVQCDCGFSATFDEYGFLTRPDGSSFTVADCTASQKKRLADMFSAADGQALFSDTVEVGEVLEHRVSSYTPGLLTAFADRVVWEDREIPFDRISGVSIFSRNKLTVHLDGGAIQYDVFGSDSFNALKYYDLYRLLGKE